ncbi:hypothetical protein FHG87_013098 [Trinorchestia longiramus]|nr:hypothetical protein FHG87_013098 [Trinorchestia longiramus]
MVVFFPFDVPLAWLKRLALDLLHKLVVKPNISNLRFRTHQKLVVKPDQLIKRRGKLGLIAVGVSYEVAQQWVQERIGKNQKVGKAVGKLRTFIIEPFLTHDPSEEAYGGVDIGDVDSKALRLEVPIETIPTAEEITSTLLKDLPAARKQRAAAFVGALYKAYVELYFTYLEINPLVITDSGVYVLDLAAKLDATAEFMAKTAWGEVDYPPPFGRDATPEEAYIADLDSKSGASLKITCADNMVYTQHCAADCAERERPNLDDGGRRRSFCYLL